MGTEGVYDAFMLRLRLGCTRFLAGVGMARPSPPLPSPGCPANLISIKTPWLVSRYPPIALALLCDSDQA
jgi:hypothetical protein